MNTNSFRTGRMARLAVLVAIVLIMSFTPLGFLPVGTLSLTLLPIPVAIGAIMFGPMAGAALGGLFGLMSFVRGVMGLDLGPILLSINPLLFFLSCVLPRVFEGAIGGIFYKGLQSILKQRIAATISGFFVAFFNTVLYLGGLILLFWSTFVAPWAVNEGADGTATGIVVFVFGLYLVQALIEAILCAAVSSAVSGIMERFFPLSSTKGG